MTRCVGPSERNIADDRRLGCGFSRFLIHRLVKGIGNDLELDPGVGICGKAGQSVPAGVGQPTLLIDGLTVGGTAA